MLKRFLSYYKPHKVIFVFDMLAALFVCRRGRAVFVQRGDNEQQFFIQIKRRRSPRLVFFARQFPDCLFFSKTHCKKTSDMIE